MPIEAERVHGLSIIFLSDKPRFVEQAHLLLDFIADSPLVAHNAAFDFGFLNAELSACGRDPVAMERMIDTLAMARVRHPGAKHSLDALCSRYGIDRSHRVKHGALLDAQLLAQIYVELTGGRQIGLSLAGATQGASDDEAIALAGPNAANAMRRPVRAPRPHHATAEEIERHKLFVATLTNPVWATLGPAIDGQDARI